MKKIFSIVAAFAAVCLYSGCEPREISTAQSSVTASGQGVLRVMAGSELKDIEAMASQIEQATGVKLKFQYSGTLDAVEKIASGADVDAVWVSHGKYLQMMPGAKERIKASDKTMMSPVLLGLKKSRADSLGWCGNSDVTWQDIAVAAKENKFSFGMTNPTSSNSGFTALVGLTAALSGKSDAISLQDIATNKTESFFKAQRLTAGSSGWLVDAYLRDQSAVDGIINYESVLLSLNKNPTLSEPLCLIYPKEGIVTADYPFMLINDARKNEYTKVVDYIRRSAFQSQIMHNTLRRPIAPDVALSDDFPKSLMIELPFPAQLELIDALLDGFQNSVRIPSHSFFVLDVSGSMGTNGGIGLLKASLTNLAGGDASVSGRFSQFMNREIIDIVTFSSEPNPVQTFSMGNNITENQDARRRITAFAQSLNANGGTAIYDSVRSAYEKAIAAKQAEGKTYYQTIVLMTDGSNTDGSTFREFKSWYQQLPEESKSIRVFPVLFGDADKDELQALADMTGGRVFDGKNADLRKTFKDIRSYQ